MVFAMVFCTLMDFTYMMPHKIEVVVIHGNAVLIKLVINQSKTFWNVTSYGQVNRKDKHLENTVYWR